MQFLADDRMYFSLATLSFLAHNPQLGTKEVRAANCSQRELQEKSKSHLQLSLLLNKIDCSPPGSGILYKVTFS